MKWVLMALGLLATGSVHAQGLGVVNPPANWPALSSGVAAQVTSGVFKLQTYTVSTLPSCAAGTKGGLAYVTDATTPTQGATLSGSGAVVTLAFCDGTNWISP